MTQARKMSSQVQTLGATFVDVTVNQLQQQQLSSSVSSDNVADFPLLF